MLLYLYFRKYFPTIKSYVLKWIFTLTMIQKISGPNAYPFLNIYFETLSIQNDILFLMERKYFQHGNIYIISQVGTHDNLKKLSI